MSELEWLDGYDKESTDELLALEGKYRTDSIVLAFEEAMNQKAARIGLENLTEEERTILAIEALERDERLSACDDRYFDTAGDLSIPLLDFIKRNGSRIHLH